MVNEAAWVWFGAFLIAAAMFLLQSWRVSVLREMLSLKSRQCCQLELRNDRLQFQLSESNKKISEAKAWRDKLAHMGLDDEEETEDECE